MVASVQTTNNTNFEAAAPSSVDSNGSSQASYDSNEARQTGIDIAAVGTDASKASKQGESLESKDGVVKTANSLFNGIKRGGSKLFNGLGFLGATATAILYFFFNSKIFSFVTAIPTVMSFGIAFGLKKSVKESEGSTSIFDDPNKILGQARNNSTFLEENFSKVIEATVDIANLKDNDPKKIDALGDLNIIAEKIRTKKYEIETIDSNQHGNYEILEINRFLEIIDKIDSAVLDAEDQSVTRVASSGSEAKSKASSRDQVA